MKMTYRVVIMFLVFVLVSHLSLALEFTELPSINEGVKPYLRNQNLVCDWESVGNESYGIRWYKSDLGGPFSYESSFDNVKTIGASSLSRGNSWICEVSIHNVTTVSANSSVAAIVPWLSFDSVAVDYVSDYTEIQENDVFDFYIRSSDPDLQGVTLGLDGNFAQDLCTTVSPGRIRCSPTHKHVSVDGTTNPGPEEVKNYTIRLFEESSGGNVLRLFTFTINPVNDQAVFDSSALSLSSVSIEAFDSWNQVISGVDEETDYPLNFSVSATPGVGASGELPIYFDSGSATDTSSVLVVDSTNAHIGNWTVTLSVEDNGSSEFAPNTHSFNLEITRVNLDPVFLTDFSDISGAQGESFYVNISVLELNNQYNLSLSISPSSSELNPFCSTEFFEWDLANITFINESNGQVKYSFNVSVNNLSNNHVICRYVDIEVFNSDVGISVLEEGVFFNISNRNDPPVIHELSFHPDNIVSNISNISVRLGSPSFYYVNASDPDDLTYDWLNTGLLNFSINDSNFNINNETGLLNLTFLDENMVGTWPINITVMDRNFSTFSMVVNVTVLNNTAPRITFGLINDSWQNNISVLYFNISDYEDIMLDRFELINYGVFDSSIYLSSETIYMLDYSVDEGENVSRWVFNLSNWVDYMADTYTPEANYFANSLVGIHNFSLLVFDEFNTHDSTLSRANLVFEVWNENDAPFFVNNKWDNFSSGENIDLIVVMNEVFNKVIHATDFDLYLPDSSENLSFSIVESLTSNNLSNVSFVKIAENEALLSFFINESGSFMITLNVTDSFNESDILTIEFDVFETTGPVEFVQVRPFLDAFNNTVNNSLGPVDSNLSNITVSWIENQTLTFDAIVSFDELLHSIGGSSPNSINVEWFVNDVSVASHTDVLNIDDFSYSHYFNFFSANINVSGLDVGVNNVTINVVDMGGSSARWTWFVNVTDVPRNVIYCNNSMNTLIEIVSFQRFGDFLGFFDKFWDDPNNPELRTQRFYNPDDDPLNTGPDSIDPCVPGFPGVRRLPSLEFSHQVTQGTCDAIFSMDDTDLIIEGRGQSSCLVRFLAWDPNVPDVIVESEEVIVNIRGEFQTDVRFVTVTEQVFVPFQEDVDVPAPLKIIYPDSLIFYQNRTVDIPLIIRNNWTETFIDVALSAIVLNMSTAQEENVSFSFSRDRIPSLAVGAEERVILTLHDYRSDQPLRVNVFAEVSEPSFTDSEILLIASLEMAADDADSVRALVTYARDLLTATPECAELNDLLFNAQNFLDQGLVDEAYRLIEGAINGCRYLLSREEALRQERPGSLRVGLDFTSQYWVEIVYSSIALIFLAIVFYVFSFVKLSLKK